MLDISQATNMLTALGVSSTLAAKAAERTAQQHGDADPLTFLKELQSTLAELSAEAPAAGADRSTAAAPAPTKPYQPTAALYADKDTEGAASAVKAPFSNMEEFRAWERGLGHTFAEDYEVPDYVRMIATPLAGGDDGLVGRYMFFKNHPEFAADYERIRSGQLSQCPTDGSTLVKTDLSQLNPETAEFYRKNPTQLLATEGFNMDPTLAKMRSDGTLEIPQGTDVSEWLMSNKWTADGNIAQNNRVAFAQAPYIGLDGKGADTYRLMKFDAATNTLIDRDGVAYDRLTGEAKA